MANIFKASITGLGNESPTSQVYTKDEGFPTSFEEVTDSLGNIFIKIPTMYRKVDSVVDNQITAFTMSTAKVDDTYEPYSVFVKPDGTVMPYVLIGKYANSSSDSIVSIQTDTCVTATIGQTRTAAKALGEGYQNYDWQFQKLLVDLCLLTSEKVNFTENGDIDEYLGLCHLTNYTAIDGISIIQQSPKYWCICYDPTKYVDTPNYNTQGYIKIGYDVPNQTGSCIKKLGYDIDNPFFNYPNEKTNDYSNSTYYCDMYGSSPNASGTNIFMIYSSIGFGSSSLNGRCGLWHLNGEYDFSFKRYARLCYRPLDETVQEESKPTEYTLRIDGVEVTDYENVIVNGVSYKCKKGANPELITFTIDGTEYQAEEGMTWNDFVADTNYNTGNFTIDSTGNFVIYPPDYRVQYSNFVPVKPTETILDGVTYEWQDD